MSDIYHKKLAFLVDEFRPLIDEALIISIAGDFSLQKPKQFQKAKATLRQIAQDVAAEEASGFNPDAFGVDELADTASQTTTQPSRPKSVGEATQSSYPSSSTDSELDDVQALAAVFPTIDPRAISHMLKKCGGNVDKAIEELISCQERGEEYALPRTIDSFFRPEDEDDRPRHKKGKKKKNKAGPSQEKLENERLDEIMHLSSLLDCHFEEVEETYNRNQHSQALALLDILETSKELGIEAKDPARVKTAKALEQEYKRIPPEYFTVLLQVCSPHISDSVKQLLSILNKHYQKPKKQKLSISYNLAPVEDPDIIDQATNSAISPKRGAPSARFTAAWDESAVSHGNLPKTTTYQQARQLSQELHEKRGQALRDAFKLARRSKGDPLLRAGVVVYLERAKGFERPASAAFSRAADLLVAETRTPYQIDLHGVTVNNAVRIAVEETRKWWQRELARGRLTCDPRKGFTIITGKGIHSTGGQSKIRAPVISALQEDGWTVAAEAGMCTVIGRKR
ncbi:uncharacterized protein BROUX77_005272 [Berkeleyomyces rouxiae]|uniref:uncharacterized protein n=1 Tax=Berkeleyomyces rouxiae TaxID=2035830 RepID=UPI003B7A29DD